uniref:UDP-glucuronosyltransferase n=1 Tax=Plectus sambesii TaxID=2011161 RepID=A0A914W260_9BILA
MKLIFLISALVSSIDASKILFVGFSNSKSHLGSMLPLAQALAKRGHDVTMYVEALRDLGELGGGVKHHYIKLQNTQDLSNNIFMDIVWNQEFLPEQMVPPYTMGSDALAEAVEQDSFWQIANQTWDLIVSDEVFTPTGWGLGMLHKKRDGTPHAAFSTTDTLQTLTTMLALSRHPTNAPSYYTPHHPFAWHTKYFMDRVSSVRHAAVEYISVGIIAEWVSRGAIELMGYSDFSWSKYYQDVSMVLIDYPDRFAWPVTQGSDTVYTGSFCRGSKPLPDDLERFVSDPASKGTIYLAFGSVVQWDFAPRRIVNAFVEAVNHLTDYRIIWSYKGKSLNVKSHVRLMEWAPQNDLLNHPKTKLFISHGGLKSVKEAICSETPVVYMPFFAEQTKSALVAKQLGFAEYLNKMTFGAQEVIDQSTKVLNDEQYQKNIIQIKSLFIDRIMDQLDEGVFWTEKVIRYRERPVFFRRAGMLLYWCQLLYLDAFALLLCALYLFSGK